MVKLRRFEKKKKKIVNAGYASNICEDRHHAFLVNCSFSLVKLRILFAMPTIVLLD